MKTIFFNRLTKSEITLNEANEISNKYNWSFDTSKEERDIIIERRKKLAEQSDKKELFGKIFEKYKNMYSNIKNEEERSKKRGKLIENSIQVSQVNKI